MLLNSISNPLNVLFESSLTIQLSTGIPRYYRFCGFDYYTSGFPLLVSQIAVPCYTRFLWYLWEIYDT
jgi:hypothetical protein